MTFAGKLHYLMLLSGISQIELSSQTKIERSTLTKILNGSTSKPKIDTIITLAKYFNVDVNELLDFTDNKKISANNYKLGETLIHLMSVKKIDNANQLGKKSGLPTNVVIDILNGKTINPKIKTLQALANFFEVSIPQLCGIDELPVNYKIPSVKIIQTSVPVLNFNQIRLWLSREKFDIQYLNVNLSQVKDTYYAIVIKDNKFFPDLFMGNVLVVDTETAPRNKDFIVAELNRAISVYQFIDKTRDKIILREAGSKIKNDVNVSNIHIFGVVIQQIINRLN